MGRKMWLAAAVSLGCLVAGSYAVAASFEVKESRQGAEVLLDGVSVKRHEGGFTRFRADISQARRGSKLTIRVDNAERAHVYPQFADFTFCGGLYRGVGLLIGCVLSEAWQGKAKDVLNAAEKEGVMVLQAGPDVVRFAPSLVVEDADIDEGLDRFERAVAQLTKG